MAGVAGIGGMIALGVVAVAAPAAPAGADPAANCSSGVIVAADFSHWGRPINSVCDPALPANAVDALQDAGFDPSGVSGYGLAFICQIAGFPQNDPCTTTPPANAYWSFWYARAGQDTWTYSQSGAMNVAPTAGSVEGWVFGGSTGASPPATFPSPDSIRAATVRVLHTPPTSSRPTTSAPSTRGPAPTSGGHAAPPPPGATSPQSGTQSGGGGPAAAAGVDRGSPVDRTDHVASGPPTSTTAVGAGPSATRRSPGRAVHATAARTGTPRIVNAAPAVAGTQAPNSPLPFLIGASAVAVLAVAAGVVARRRRRTG